MWIIIAALGMFVISVVVISFPLVRDSLEYFDERESDDEEYSERDALLEALSDLELSFDTGKISEAAYKNQKLELQKQYLKVVEGEATQ